MKHIRKIPVIFVFCLLNVFLIKGQIPTHIDPGQNENPVSLYQQPEFIIPILGLFVLLAGYYVWRKKKSNP